MILDRLIGEFDRALRAVAGVAHSSRPSPARRFAKLLFEKRKRPTPRR